MQNTFYGEVSSISEVLLWEIITICYFIFLLLKSSLFMTELTIEKKKYILLPEESYQALQKMATLKSKNETLFTVEEARLYSKRLIRKWAEEK
jgi:hypothetical protein